MRANKHFFDIEQILWFSFKKTAGDLVRPSGHEGVSTTTALAAQ
jgi:hypothetical protein